MSNKNDLFTSSMEATNHLEQILSTFQEIPLSKFHHSIQQWMSRCFTFNAEISGGSRVNDISSSKNNSYSNSRILEESLINIDWLTLLIEHNQRMVTPKATIRTRLKELLKSLFSFGENTKAHDCCHSNVDDAGMVIVSLIMVIVKLLSGPVLTSGFIAPNNCSAVSCLKTFVLQGFESLVAGGDDAVVLKILMTRISNDLMNSFDAGKLEDQLPTSKAKLRKIVKSFDHSRACATFDIVLWLCTTAAKGDWKTSSSSSTSFNNTATTLRRRFPERILTSVVDIIDDLSKLINQQSNSSEEERQEASKRQRQPQAYKAQDLVTNKRRRKIANKSTIVKYLDECSDDEEQGFYDTSNDDNNYTRDEVPSHLRYDATAYADNRRNHLSVELEQETPSWMMPLMKLRDDLMNGLHSLAVHMHLYTNDSTEIGNLPLLVLHQHPQELCKEECGDHDDDTKICSNALSSLSQISFARWICMIILASAHPTTSSTCLEQSDGYECAMNCLWQGFVESTAPTEGVSSLEVNEKSDAISLLDIYTDLVLHLKIFDDDPLRLYHVLQRMINYVRTLRQTQWKKHDIINDDNNDSSTRCYYYGHHCDNVTRLILKHGIGRILLYKHSALLKLRLHNSNDNPSSHPSHGNTMYGQLMIQLVKEFGCHDFLYYLFNDSSRNHCHHDVIVDDPTTTTTTTKNSSPKDLLHPTRNLTYDDCRWFIMLRDIGVVESSKLERMVMTLANNTVMNDSRLGTPKKPTKKEEDFDFNKRYDSNSIILRNCWMTQVFGRITLTTPDEQSSSSLFDDLFSKQSFKEFRRVEDDSMVEYNHWIGKAEQEQAANNNTDNKSIDDVLGDDVMVHIFSYLNFKRVLKLSIVCRRWLHIGRNSNLWNEFYVRRWNSCIKEPLIIYPKKARHEFQTTSWYDHFKEEYIEWMLKCRGRVWNHGGGCGSSPTKPVVRPFHFNGGVFKYRLCPYVGCYQVMSNPKRLQEHTQKHLMDIQKQKEEKPKKRRKSVKEK